MGDPEDRPDSCLSGAQGWKPKALGPGKPSPARAGSGLLPGVVWETRNMSRCPRYETGASRADASKSWSLASSEVGRC